MTDTEDVSSTVVGAGGFDSRPRRRVATYRQIRTMTDEWQKSALVDSPRVYYEIDGSIEEQKSTVEVKVTYNEINEIRFEPDKKDYNEDELEELSEKYDPGEFIDADYRNGAHARLRYEVEGGVARLSSFKDVSPESGGWIRLEFLKTLDAAERVVENVPGVEYVESAGQTMSELLAEGEGAEIDPA